jgi:cobalamin-dependent methionine synthase I
MAQEAATRGYRTGGIISPGMPGFPVTEQKHLFELVPAREIGVSLTRGGVMVPRKSSSMLIGMGPQLKHETTAALCNRCRLQKTCQYRAPAEGRAGSK